VTGNAVVQGGYQSSWPTDSALISQANAAKAQALYYCGLSSTMGPNKIKTSGMLTLSGVAGLNVLNLSELSLSGNAMLTLSGPVGAQFVINVDDKFSLSGNSQVKVSGGVDPLDVIFNFKGKKATMSGNTMLNGVIMAADGTFEGSGNAIVKGQVVASKIRLDGNAKIVSP
jgi:choice-of-anchor A domain-containing protein